MRWNWRIQMVWAGVVLALIATASMCMRNADSTVRPTGAQKVSLNRRGADRVDAAEQSAGWQNHLTTALSGTRQVIAYRPDGQLSVSNVQLCQFSTPQSHSPNAVDQLIGIDPWEGVPPMPSNEYGQGEYIGPPRSPHVPTYLIRVNDLFDFVYQFTHEASSEEYRLTVGDEIVVETFPNEADAIRRGDLATGRGLQVQPDGTIFLPYVGRLMVSGRTINEVRQNIEKLLTQPPTGRFRPGTVDVVITPVKTNTRLEDLRSAVDARFGSGGQTRSATVTPEGTLQLVGIGSVPAQGMTIPELEAEINARYADRYGTGIQISIILRQYAPRYIWVAGEVAQPGQYQVNQPLTVVQAIALARGFNVGGNVRQVVVFRRNDNWQLMATRLNVRGVFVGTTPYPCEDIWLRDNDLVVVPKGPILQFDQFVNLVFTRGIFACFPLQGSTSVNF